MWISVLEKKPENNSPFLGTDGEVLFVAYYCEDIERYMVGGWQDCYYCGGKSRVNLEGNKSSWENKAVTHWMPLPELPK